MKQRLFVYGTIHPDRAPAEIKAVVKKLVPIGQGTISGTLQHDLGPYPALTLNGKKTQRVRGAVFALPDAETLRRLDRYEEYLPADPENSLFIRSKRLVTFDDGTRRFCWVYTYNQKLPQPR